MSGEFARTGDVLLVLGRERVSYPYLIDTLVAHGLPTRGVGVVIKGPEFSLFAANGEPWRDSNYMKDANDPTYQFGPLMIEAARFGVPEDEGDTT